MTSNLQNERRFSIPLMHGFCLTAEASGDPNYPMELYIGIEDSNGCWVQDLVVVSKNYHYKSDGQIDYTDDAFKILVYADNRRDDCTDEFLVPLRDDLDE